MPKSPEEMAASMFANVEEKTGKTLDAWLKIITKTKLAKHREILNHLKAEHGVTHGYANLIASKALESDEPPANDETLVEAISRSEGRAASDLRQSGRDRPAVRQRCPDLA